MFHTVDKEILQFFVKSINQFCIYLIIEKYFFSFNSIVSKKKNSGGAQILASPIAQISLATALTGSKQYNKYYGNNPIKNGANIYDRCIFALGTKVW